MSAIWGKRACSRQPNCVRRRLSLMTRRQCACRQDLRREVPTRIERVVGDQVAESSFSPAPWCLVALAGEDADGNWDGNVLGAEEAELVSPSRDEPKKRLCSSASRG